MSKRNPRLLFEDVLEAIDKIAEYTKGMTYETFVADSKYPDVEWHRIVGLRNRLIHGYFRSGSRDCMACA